jgi:hypothetical protein
MDYDLDWLLRRHQTVSDQPPQAVQPGCIVVAAYVGMHVIDNLSGIGVAQIKVDLKDQVRHLVNDAQ